MDAQLEELLRQQQEKEAQDVSNAKWATIGDAYANTPSFGEFLTGKFAPKEKMLTNLADKYSKATSPVEDFERKSKLEDYLKQKQRQNMMRDPNSVQSQVAYETLSKVSPQLAERLKGKSAEDIESVFQNPLLKEQMKAQIDAANDLRRIRLEKDLSRRNALDETFAKLGAEKQKEEALKQVSGFSRVQGSQISKEEAEKARAAAASLGEFEQYMNELKNSVKQHGTELFGSESRKQADLVNKARMKLKDVQQLGALSGSDYSTLEAQVTDPTTFSSAFSKNETIGSSLSDQIASAKAGLEAKLKTYGYTPEKSSEFASENIKRDVPESVQLAAKQELERRRQAKAQEQMKATTVNYAK